MKRHAKAVPTATLSLVALLFSLFLFAAPAHASKGVVEIWGSDVGGPCQAGDPVDCINRPQGIGVNYTTGDVYVVDGGNRVVRFDENGIFERAWGWDVDADDPGTGFEICVAPATCQRGVGGTGTAQLSSATGLAIDQSNGDVYVSSNNGIAKYDLDGNHIRTQPGANTGIAVKPGSNSLLVAGASISWLDSAGNPLASFGLGGIRCPRSSQLTGPVSAGWVAADSAGDIYAGPEQHANGSCPALKLGNAGTSPGLFAPDSLDGHVPTVLGSDPVNDRIYIGRRDRPGSGDAFHFPGDALHEIAEFNTSGQLLDLHATGMPRMNAITVNPSTGRLYVAVGAGVIVGHPAVASGILVIDAVINAPVPMITSISPITTSGATLNGTVNPQGTQFSTGYHWEYRKQGVQNWTVTPTTDVGNGTDPVAVDPQPISGLEPNMTYEVRLVAIRKGGAGSAIDTETFKTLALPPTVTERSAYPVGDTSAQLRAVVNPNNTATEYFFEYGTNEDYGSTTPVRSTAAANEAVPLYATVKGLQPETTYHFRLVADNGVGDPVEGPDLELTTRSTAEVAWPGRGIELVTPPDTGGQSPRAYISPVSDRVVWGTLTGSPGSPVGNGSAFISERTLRTPTGWESRSLLPPIDQLLGNGADNYTPVRAAPDFSSAILKRYNDFSQDYVFLSSPLDQPVSQAVIASLPAPPNAPTNGAWSATADLTHSFIRTQVRLVPAHVAGTSAVYDVSYDPPRLVSRLPNGSVPVCGVPEDIERSGFMGGLQEYDWFSSASGPGVPLRLYFQSKSGTDCSGPGDLFMRDDKGTEAEADDETHLVSGPPQAGPAMGGFYLRTNAAGNSVIFVSRTRLDSDDTNSGADIYKWTLDGGNDCLTCIVPNADVNFKEGYDSKVVVSADLRRMYFRSSNQLVASKGQAGSPNNLYVLRDLPGEREIAYIGQASAGALEQANGEFGVLNQLSANGEVMVFKSSDRTTPDRNGGVAQFYRYDDADGSLECLSCPPPGVAAAPAEGNFTGGFGAVGVLGLVPTKLLTADGGTFVFTSKSALVPKDVNGSIDVYEANRDGRVRLVTDGVTRFSAGAGAPALQGISDDGKNILFGVGARLTGHEIDDVRQIYVARTGGGLPPPDPIADPCVEDACQGPLQAVPSFANPGSSSLRGAPNARQETPTRRCAKNKVRRGQRCVAKRKRAVCAKGKAKPAKRCKSKGKANRRAKARSERSAK